MSRDDKLAGGWHLLAVIGVGLFVWEVGGLLGWWRMTRKRQYHECKCG